MTILKVMVDDLEAEAIANLLRKERSVRNIEVESVGTEQVKYETDAYTRIKKILEEAKGKNLFEDIKDPTEWQRELRKEWDRDF